MLSFLRPRCRWLWQRMINVWAWCVGRSSLPGSRPGGYPGEEDTTKDIGQLLEGTVALSVRQDSLVTIIDLCS